MVGVLHEGVTCLNEINRIHKERWGWWPQMTILYDGKEDIQIVKLVVGVVHEFATCFDEINRIHEERWGWLPHMMILHDEREKILIVKFMVGVLHECATCSMKLIGSMMKNKVGYHTWQLCTMVEKIFKLWSLWLVWCMISNMWICLYVQREVVVFRHF